MNTISIDARIRRPCPSCESTAFDFQRLMAGYEICECKACGSAYAGCVPGNNELSQAYARLYATGGGYQGKREEVEIIRRARAHNKLLKIGWERKLFFSKLSPKPGARLLDIGCGTGLFIFSAQRRGWKPRGIELSREAAELGRAVHELPVHIGRVEDFESEEQFEAITAWEVFEHIPQPRSFAQSVLHMLAPGGVFAGSVPNYSRPRYRHGQDLGVASVPPVHLNFWTPAALRHTLQAAGFKDVEVVVPRICTNLLGPFGIFRWSKLSRFLRILAGRDTPTEMFFRGTKR